MAFASKSVFNPTRRKGQIQKKQIQMNDGEIMKRKRKSKDDTKAELLLLRFS